MIVLQNMVATTSAMTSGRNTSRNANAALLTRREVQHARDLHRAGFSGRSIADALRVCPRTVRNIVKGRAWQSVPDRPGPLPLFPLNLATRLKVRSTRRLTDQQQNQLEHYCQQIILAHSLHAERVTHAISLMNRWMLRRPKGAGAEEVKAAGGRDREGAESLWEARPS